MKPVQKPVQSFGKGEVESSILSRSTIKSSTKSKARGSDRKAFRECLQVRQNLVGRKTLPIPVLEPADKARFWRLVSLGPPDECWPWSGAATAAGYGRFRIGRRLYSTHRVAYSITGNDPLGGRADSWVLHSCDNPGCCNPGHLTRGTALQNAKDMVARGRASR